MSFLVFGAFLSLIPDLARTVLDEILLAIRSRTVVRNQGEPAFPEVYLAVTRVFFLFCLKERLFKSPFLKGITTYEDCNDFKVTHW